MFISEQKPIELSTLKYKYQISRTHRQYNTSWDPQMPSWQCFHFETVSGLCLATNQNAELHNGDTFQECL